MWFGSGRAAGHSMGCRRCGRSADVVRISGRVICALDRLATEALRREGKTTYVYWSTQQQLPDFDQIEIRDASDQDVEAFVIAVRNESDQSCYRRCIGASCRVSQNVSLSENSLRMLHQTFRRVRTWSTGAKLPTTQKSVGGC